MTTDSLSLRAPDAHKEYIETIKQVDRNCNAIINILIWSSLNTDSKIKIKTFIVCPADLKSESRLKAFDALRSPLFLCDLIQSYKRKGSPDELLYSSVYESVMLNGWKEKTQVVSCTAKEAKEFL